MLATKAKEAGVTRRTVGRAGSTEKKTVVIAMLRGRLPQLIGGILVVLKDGIHSEFLIRLVPGHVK
jgi:hypothetical protein